MVNDIAGAIQTGGAFLSAFGLMCDIEVCGRRIIYNNNPKINGFRCFNEFLDKYMGLGFLLNQKFPFEGKLVSLKDAVRNGLVHNFIMNCDSSGIYLNTKDSNIKRNGFFTDRHGHLSIYVIPLFEFFIDGLKKAKSNGELK